MANMRMPFGGLRLTSTAKEQRSVNRDWAYPFVGPEGVKVVAPATAYNLTDLVCRNEQALEQDVSARLEAMRLKSHIHVDEIGAYAFENVTIMPHGVMLVNEKIIAETLIPLPSNDHYISPVMNYLINLDDSHCSGTEKIIDCPVLIIDQPGIFNYGHWLAEIFPKLSVFLEDIVSKKLNIALPYQFRDWGFIKSMLDFLKIDTNTVIWYDLTEIKNNNILKFKKVIYVSPISKHPFPGYISPWSMETLSHLTRKITPGRAKKIFVSREDAPNRFLSNEHQIYSYLRGFGYEFIQTALLSFQEQVEIFKGASHVVGVYGASMTNVCFCGPDTKIMSIAPSYHIDHFYWDILSIKEITYHYCVGQPLNPNKNDPFRDFKVEMGEIEAAFDIFEAEECRTAQIFA